MTWRVDQADCLEWLAALEPDSVDLVFGSPPYRLARTYGIDFKLADQAWVDWMVKVFTLAQRACKGLVAFVVEGQTKNYRWTAEPALLMADLHRAGLKLRKPPAFRRVGIPGSGGPDWLRNDYEFIVCTSRGKLPWSDNTAMGHKPKWAPGGEMSYRLSDGSRTNQWGKCGTEAGVNGSAQRTRDGGRQKAKRPSHVMTSKGEFKTRTDKRIKDQGRDSEDLQTYVPPVKANPGNVITCKVGGGLMGSPLSHENEAPFPETLAEFFVRSFCPPGGTVADCFSGSGTVGAVSVRWNRNFLGCDVRQSQVELSRKRIEGETPMLIQ